MKKSRLFSIITFSLCLAFSITRTSWAQETKKNEPGKFWKALHNIEFLTGFGMAKLNSKGNYHLYPLLVDFDFDLVRHDQKKYWFLPAAVQFIDEPFATYVSSPDSNAEVGNNFLFKICLFSDEARLQPYVKIGVGMVYLSQHTREQSTQFNFNEYGGGGVHYFFTKNMGVTLECRIRHVSNAGIRQPNHGINSYFGLCGLTYNF